MNNNLRDIASQYKAAEVMGAVGMIDFPEIGSVAEYLKMLQIAPPRPNAGQVAIKLAASSMHIDEIYAAQGTALGRFYGPKKVSESNPRLMGSSVSGTIVAVGDDVTQFNIDDEVIAIPSQQMETGSWATYRCIDQDMVMLKPDALSHVEAAALTMAACVAWGAVGSAKVRVGHHCAIVGATGAIGIMILQFLKSIGCQVTAICSGANAEFARQYGADHVVDYTQNDFGEAAIQQGIQYDAVFDCVGGRNVEVNAFRCLDKSGVFTTVVGPMQYVGQTKLSWPKLLSVMSHILWRIAITRMNGGPKYTFSAKYPHLLIKDAFNQLLLHKITMPIAATIPFAINPIREAVSSLMAHRTKGRIVIDFNQ